MVCKKWSACACCLPCVSVASQEQHGEMLESAAVQVCKKYPILQMFTCQQQSENFHRRFKTIEDRAKEAIQSFHWYETGPLMLHVSLTIVHNGSTYFLPVNCQ